MVNLHHLPEVITELLRRRLGLGRRPALRVRAASCWARRAGSRTTRSFLGDADLPGHERRLAHRRRPHGLRRGPPGVRRHRHAGRHRGRRPVAVRRRRDSTRRQRHRFPGEAGPGRRAVEPLQLRHVRLRAGRSSSASPRPRSTTSASRCCPNCCATACRSTPTSSTGTGATWATCASTVGATSTPWRVACVSISPAARCAPGVWVGEGSDRCRLGGHRAAGAARRGCIVGEGATLEGPVVIGDGTVIEAGARLHEVITWSGAHVGADSQRAGRHRGSPGARACRRSTRGDGRGGACGRGCGQRGWGGPTRAAHPAGARHAGSIRPTGRSPRGRDRAGTFERAASCGRGRPTPCCRCCCPRAASVAGSSRPSSASAARARSSRSVSKCARGAARRGPGWVRSRRWAHLSGRRACRPEARQPSARWSGRPTACAVCVGAGFAFASARSAFLYRGAARELVSSFKHGGQRCLGTDHGGAGCRGVRAGGRRPWQGGRHVGAQSSVCGTHSRVQPGRSARAVHWRVRRRAAGGAFGA